MKDFIDDPWWGKGGRYVVDPETGRRVPAPPDPDAAEVPPAPQPETAPQPVKEKRRG